MPGAEPAAAFAANQPLGTDPRPGHFADTASKAMHWPLLIDGKNRPTRARCHRQISLRATENKLAKKCTEAPEAHRTCWAFFLHCSLIFALAANARQRGSLVEKPDPSYPEHESIRQLSTARSSSSHTTIYNRFLNAPYYYFIIRFY